MLFHYCSSNKRVRSVSSYRTRSTLHSNVDDRYVANKEALCEVLEDDFAPNS